ncbi:hypothetical protein AKJ09_08398 [Labilithrix luteola]|uniref:Uncharacterized protein n=1 Tax=Labilithrix luteola TaxID=1391654 RepID=A0A0K1Q8M5_9BACT|nr:hypothetical protein [Labilithrix luteola]AKV01735.1 hypothetical protein AKJ09_08398 [Labilithrix luteola]
MKAQAARAASILSFLATGAAAFLALPKEASAQEWLKDRRAAEGAGIRAGDLEIHPGIGGEIGYDSNWFLRSYKEDPRFVNGAPLNPPQAAGIIRITPSISISTLGAQRREQQAAGAEPSPIAFRAGAAATYREFIGPEDIRKQRNVSVNANARLDVNPGRPLGFGVFANYQRLIQPSVVSDPNLSFNRDDVGAGAEVIAMPGGGTLDLRAGYQFFGSFFEDSNGVPYTNLTHEVSFRDRWKFRPRTALFHDTSLRFITYPNADRSLNYLNDSTPLRTRIGLTGLVTDRFGTLLAVGYGATFFKNPNAVSTPQYDSVNAQAEGTFYLSPGGQGEPGQVSLLLSTLTFGYVRDFQNSLLGNFYSSNKGYAKLVYNFAGRAVIQLDGYFEALSYPQPYYNVPGGAPQAVNGLNGQPTGDFTNWRVGGILFGEYRFSDSFGLNATFDYSQTISDIALASGTTGTVGAAQFYDMSWRRFQALFGARWFL